MACYHPGDFFANWHKEGFRKAVKRDWYMTKKDMSYHIDNGVTCAAIAAAAGIVIPIMICGVTKIMIEERRSERLLDKTDYL